MLIEVSEATLIIIIAGVKIKEFNYTVTFDLSLVLLLNP